MAYVAVNKFIISPLELTERLFNEKPKRADNEIWTVPYTTAGIETVGTGLPKGSIKKLIGRELTWNDEPVELV